MTWATSTIVLPPSAVQRAIEQGKACLGPGPRGLTFSTRQIRRPLAPLAFEYGEREEVTLKFTLVEVLWEEDEPGLKYVVRRWVED